MLPSCKIWWNYRCSTRLDVSLHTSQGYVLSSYLLHWMFYYTLQQSGRSPACTNWCTCKCSSFLNLILQHHKDVDAPEYVYVDVRSDYFCYWMFYYTHHNNMDAPQYVHVDVTSALTWKQMFCHTHHSDMDAPQYVYFDAPSGFLFYWMFYYTHHNDMDAPQYGHVDVPSDYLW